MFSRYAAAGILQHIAGYQAIFAKPTAYVALFTTAPSDDGGGGAVEVSGGGYARVATSAASWNPATAPPVRIDNATTISFSVAGANWGTVVAVGLYDSATSGNLLAWDWLSEFLWQPCTISAASPAIIDMPNNGFAVGDDAIFTVVFGGISPTLAAGSGALGSNNLSVVSAASGDTFTITTAGGAVNTSGTGNGMVRKVRGQSVPMGVTMVFPPGSMILQMSHQLRQFTTTASGFTFLRSVLSPVIFITGRAIAVAIQQGAASVASHLSGLANVNTKAASTLSTSSTTPALGTGTSSTDELGTGTGSSDVLGVP